MIPAGRNGMPPGRRPVLLIDRLARAGTERHVLRLAAALEGRGEEPLLVTFEPPPSQDLEPPCRHEIVPFRSFGSPSIVPAILRLRGLLRRHRAGVLHAFFHDSTVLGFLATAGSPVPLVSSVRQIPYNLGRSKRLQLHLAFRGCSRVLVNARAVRDAFLADYRFDPARVRVIYNGVRVPDPPPAPDPRILDAAPAGKVVGIVANLNRPVKRVDVFLRAAARVAASDPGARFVVVGSGELEPPLRELAADLGIGDRVLFTGSVPDALPLVAGFSIGVLSSDLEGLPNAVLEYMAAGIPVVATRTGGIPELVEPGRTGILVPTGDPDALAAAILELLGDPDLGTRMGERGRRRARQEFSEEAALMAHLAVYREVAGGRTKR